MIAQSDNTNGTVRSDKPRRKRPLVVITLTPQEAALALGVGLSTLQHLTDKEGLPYVPLTSGRSKKTGGSDREMKRYRPEDMDQWAKARVKTNVPASVETAPTKRRPTRQEQTQ
jgi:hypothetical protein